MTAYETFAGSAVGCLTLIDEFARERGTHGLMPVPIPPLRFSLVERKDQANMIALDPPITLYAQSGPSGAFLFADEARIGDTARMRIAPGTYRLRIESDYYLTGEPILEWPPNASVAPLPLRPSSAYPFPDVTVPGAQLTLLRGSVLDEVTGAAVVGADVEMTAPADMGPFAKSRSDSRGAWVLAVPLPAAPPIQMAALKITLPSGGGVIDVPNVKLFPSAENSLPQTALRGSVLTTTGSAIAGAEITVDTMPGKSVRSGRDGAWSFYFGLNQPDGSAQVTATAPNGQNQLQNVDVINRKTIVVPTFRFAMN